MYKNNILNLIFKVKNIASRYLVTLLQCLPSNSWFDSSAKYVGLATEHNMKYKEYQKKCITTERFKIVATAIYSNVRIVGPTNTNSMCKQCIKMIWLGHTGIAM